MSGHLPDLGSWISDARQFPRKRDESTIFKFSTISPSITIIPPLGIDIYPI